MVHTSIARLGCILLLLTICILDSFVVLTAHESDIDVASNFIPPLDNRADMLLNSLFSGPKLAQLQELLREMPPEAFVELEKVAGRVINKLGDTNEAEKLQHAIVQAAKEQGGLLESWKDKLDSLVLDDGKTEKTSKCQSGNVKCAEEKQNNPKPAPLLQDNIQESVKVDSNATPPATAHQKIGNNDVNYLLETAEEMETQPEANQAATPQRIQSPPSPNKKPAAKMPKPSASAYDKKRGETNRTPPKKKKPMDALVGMAKQYLGQEENDPTLDILANMASAYMQVNDDKLNDNNGPDLNSILQMASLFTGGGSQNSGDNPLQSILSLLDNSGMDLNQVLQIGSSLLGQNGLVSSSRKGKEASNVPELIIRFLANILHVDATPLIDYFNGLNSLMEANSWDQINVILRRTTGTDAEAMLDLLANEKIRQQMSDTATATLVQWLQDYLNPDSLQSRAMIINAMLLQYGYPMIDTKNLIESVSVLAEQLSKTFAGAPFNLRPYLKEAEAQLKYTLNLDSNSVIDFRNFSREELSHAVEYTMKTEVFDPLADIWSAFRLASRYPKCARFILCRQNAPPTTRTSLGLKEGITRATR